MTITTQDSSDNRTIELASITLSEAIDDLLAYKKKGAEVPPYKVLRWIFTHSLQNKIRLSTFEAGVTALRRKLYPEKSEPAEEAIESPPREALEEEIKTLKARLQRAEIHTTRAAVAVLQSKVADTDACISVSPTSPGMVEVTHSDAIECLRVPPEELDGVMEALTHIHQYRT